MINLTDPAIQINDISIAKYKSAGLITSKVIDEIIKHAKPNKKLVELITLGTTLMNNELNKVYPDIKYKGLCFPICLSLNHIAGHYIPTDIDVVKDGDLLKIELGVHIDGYPSCVVYSTIVNNNKKLIDDKRADVMKACIECSKDIIKIMKPGNTNCDVAKIMEEYATKYNCNSPVCNEQGAIPGVLSYQMSRYVVDGYNDDEDEFIHRFILSKQNPNHEFSMRENKFDEDEVYSIDIVMSTGPCKLFSLDTPNIYRRNHEQKTLLKLQASRGTLNLFNKERFPIALPKDTKTRLGLKECMEKQLLEKYPVVMDKEGEYIARIKFTVIVKNDPILVSGKSGDGELKKLKQ